MNTEIITIKQLVTLIGGEDNILSYTSTPDSITMELDSIELCLTDKIAILPHIKYATIHDTSLTISFEEACKGAFETEIKYIVLHNAVTTRRHPQIRAAATRVIRPGKQRSYAIQAQARELMNKNEGVTDITDEIDLLYSLLDMTPLKKAESHQEDQAKPKFKLLVINGPSINFLGIREPKVYGSESYAKLIKTIQEHAHKLNVAECSCFQSNHEGEIIDEILKSYHNVDGIIINPAAYTHTSLAIADALSATSIPYVEVHLSDVAKREAFRQVSYVRDKALTTITGKGIQGYVEALDVLVDYLKQQSDHPSCN